MISADLAPLLESGVSILVGTRDGNLVSECTRGLGARVEAGGTELTTFVSEPLAGRTLENVADNHRIAVCFTRPIDHYSIQIKGRVLEVREASDEDLALVDRYRAGVARTLAEIGLPTRFTMRIATRPCWAIRFAAESMFVQTPGPGAGNPLAVRGSEVSP